MLTLTITRRLIGRMGALAAVMPVLVVAVFVFATNVFFDEQTLTGEQEAQRTLGVYEASLTRLSAALPPGSAVMDRVQTDLDAAGAGVDIALQVPDFPLFELEDDGIYYREMDWSDNPFPSALHVREGRMPRAAGEIAVVGSGFRRPVALGQRLDVLAQPDALTVVGLVDNALVNQHQVLAAPGTWQTLQVPADQTLSQLTASPTFYFSGNEPSTSLSTLVRVLIANHAPGADRADPHATQAMFDDALITRSRAETKEHPAWTTRSPLSFWAPSLLLTPLSVVLCFFALMRRLGPSLRVMTRAGVQRRTAVGGAWLAVMTWIGGAALIGSLLGSAGGHAAAQWGAGSWSNPGATWRPPMAGVAALTLGLTIGSLAGWWLLVGRVRPVRETSAARPRRRPSPTAVRHLRHALATLLACGVLVQLGALRTPADGMRLTCLVALGAALLSPDLFAVAVRHLPQRSLTDRLTSRMLAGSSGRGAATTALLVLAVAVTVGFLTSLSSAVEVEARKQQATALPGQVALDGDDTPALPVSRAVVEAAETVPALAEQDPVQLWSVGRVVRDAQNNVVDLEGTVGTRELPGITFAFATTSDLARVLQRPLSAHEKDTLRRGGVLVIDEIVRTAEGRVVLVDNSTGRTAAVVPAARTSVARTPWFQAVPGVILTATARQHGWALTAGALIYTGVLPREAAAVPAALSERGINPENAEIHRALPPVIPEAALLASAVGLFALLMLVATSATRSQVVAMRLWASRLTQLGVRLSWARRVMWRQYGWLLLISLPVGLLAGVLPLLLTRALVPKIVIVVPWQEIGVLLACLVASVLGACLVAARSLTASEAIGWRDQGE